MNKHNHTHVHDFLKQHHMGVLSTVAANNKPWGSAIYFVTDEDFNVFFVTRVETFKYHNLEENSFAALTVADEESQTTVQMMGNVSRVPVESYMDVVFTKLSAIRPKGDINWVPPLEKIHEGNYMPLRLTPSKLQYANYKKQSNDIGYKYIEKII